MKRGRVWSFQLISSARRRIALPAACAASSSSNTAIDKPLPVSGSSRWYVARTPGTDAAASTTQSRSSVGIGSHTATRAIKVCLPPHELTPPTRTSGAVWRFAAPWPHSLSGNAAEHRRFEAPTGSPIGSRQPIRTNAARRTDVRPVRLIPCARRGGQGVRVVQALPVPGQRVRGAAAAATSRWRTPGFEGSWKWLTPGLSVSEK